VLLLLVGTFLVMNIHDDVGISCTPDLICVFENQLLAVGKKFNPLGIQIKPQFRISCFQMLPVGHLK
jgi:hypothetical protein